MHFSSLVLSIVSAVLGTTLVAGPAVSGAVIPNNFYLIDTTDGNPNSLREQIYHPISSSGKKHRLNLHDKKEQHKLPAISAVQNAIQKLTSPHTIAELRQQLNQALMAIAAVDLTMLNIKGEPANMLIHLIATLIIMPTTNKATNQHRPIEDTSNYHSFLIHSATDAIVPDADNTFKQPKMSGFGQPYSESTVIPEIPLDATWPLLPLVGGLGMPYAVPMFANILPVSSVPTTLTDMASSKTVPNHFGDINADSSNQKENNHAIVQMQQQQMQNDMELQLYGFC
ncbi:hypothetical protein BDF19DRAFT_468667 [Syncephalis fuscata]|nr:hypothetical protein BDF19DRAFT_468667 [Syncephalis fuscata]